MTVPSASSITAQPLRFASQFRAARQLISDRVRAVADDHARASGWTVTASTGRLGMGARTYRDPRFTTQSQSRHLAHGRKVTAR